MRRGWHRLTGREEIRVKEARGSERQCLLSVDVWEWDEVDMNAMTESEVPLPPENRRAAVAKWGHTFCLPP